MSGWLASMVGVGGSTEKHDGESQLLRVQTEIEAELEHHWDLLADECRRDGVPEEEIEALVRKRFGDRTALGRACLEQRMRGSFVKEKLHRLATIGLALAVMGLVFAQHRSQVEARLQIESLHSELEHVMNRLQEEQDAARSANGATALVGDVVVLVDTYGSLKGSYVVDVGGSIVLPDLGRIDVVGLTAEEIQGLLRARAEPLFVDSEVFAAIHRVDSNGVLEAITTSF